MIWKSRRETFMQLGEYADFLLTPLTIVLRAWESISV
jgi:hypothetical protein